MEEVPDFVKGEKVLSIWGKMQIFVPSLFHTSQMHLYPSAPNYPQDG